MLPHAAHLLALLHDLNLLISHVQHLFQDGRAAVQCSVLCLQAANLLGKLFNLLVQVLDFGLQGARPSVLPVLCSTIMLRPAPGPLTCCFRSAGDSNVSHRSYYTTYH